MPAKNLIRIESDNGHYHVYNRGVEKRTIFEDEQDYKVFLSFLKEYLSPPQDISKIKKSFTFQGIPHQPKNFDGKIDLIAYCLMPNHFHFILFQKNKQNIQNFMQAITTRYSMYFNKKYERVGTLFQGTYKSVFIDNENYLLHLSRYIHLNPLEKVSKLDLAHSSYGDYLGIRKTQWVKPQIVMSFFGKISNQHQRNTWRINTRIILAGLHLARLFIQNPNGEI